MPRRPVSHYAERRQTLIGRYFPEGRAAIGPAHPDTRGVHHLALVCSDLERTIEFYTEVLGMPLVKIVPNRDEPTSTHIFFDMGGSNLLAFFDFPEHHTNPTQLGVGSMHHVAITAPPNEYRIILQRLRERGVQHSVHGSDTAGSIYLHDPDGIVIEITSQGFYD
jgi:catechol 2,3-dioxygenase-like lactoylglutathione lyase family enzyme